MQESKAEGLVRRVIEEKRGKEGWERLLEVFQCAGELGWLAKGVASYHDQIALCFNDPKRTEAVYENLMEGLRALVGLLHEFNVGERWSLVLYIMRNPVQVIEFVDAFATLGSDNFAQKRAQVLSEMHRYACLHDVLKEEAKKDLKDSKAVAASLKRVEEMMYYSRACTRQSKKDKDFAMMIAEHMLGFAWVYQDLRKVLASEEYVFVVPCNMTRSLVHSNYNPEDLKQVYDLVERILEDCKQHMDLVVFLNSEERENLTPEVLYENVTVFCAHKD